MTLILKADEVADLLTFEEAIDLTEKMLRQQAAGQTVGHTPIRVSVPTRIRSLRIVSGALLEEGVVGARIGAGGGPVCLLFDVETGELKSIMSHLYSKYRTGASVALGTKWLSRPESKVLGLIGTGNNAIELLEGQLHVRAIEEIRVYSRSEANREAFAKLATAQLGHEVRPVSTPSEAVKGVDILITSTNATSPVFDLDDLAPGTHIGSMGSANELPLELYAAPTELFSSSRQQEQQYGIYRAMLWKGPQLHTLGIGDLEAWAYVKDLAVAISGSWSRPEGAVTTYRDAQGGVGDLIFAETVYERARERGRGIEVDLSHDGA